MKRLFILFLLCPLFSLGQSDSSKWSVGGGASFDRTYRWLATEGDESIKELYDTLESQDFGMSSRFIVMYDVGKSVRINSGIAYARRGFQIDTLKSAGVKDMVERFHQLEIPVGARIHFLKKKSSMFFFDAGVFASYMFKHQGRFRDLIRDTETRFSNTSNYNAIGFGWYGGAGFRAQLDEAYSIAFDLSYRQNINSIAEGDLTRRLNALAFGISILHDL